MWLKTNLSFWSTETQFILAFDWGGIQQGLAYQSYSFFWMLPAAGFKQRFSRCIFWYFPNHSSSSRPTRSHGVCITYKGVNWPWCQTTAGHWPGNIHDAEEMHFSCRQHVVPRSRFLTRSPQQFQCRGLVAPMCTRNHPGISSQKSVSVSNILLLHLAGCYNALIPEDKRSQTLMSNLFRHHWKHCNVDETLWEITMRPTRF